MRKPTTPEAAYSWHTKALAANGDRARMPPIHENEPKPGWYMRRLIPKGPYVSARIWLEASVGDDGELLGPETLFCEVDGQRRNVGSEWTWLASRPISEDRFMDMLAGNFTSSEPEPTGVFPEEDVPSLVPDEPQATQEKSAKTLF